MQTHLRPALVMLLLFTLLCGGLYPLAVTALGQLLFAHQAQGSLLERQGRIIGSALLGQSFHDDKYFHGRPSAAGNKGYDASASGGSNYGPASKALQQRIATDLSELRRENPQQPVPGELLMASASGLDPDISPQAARFQIPRIAKARGINVQRLQLLVAEHTQGRWLGFIGEPRVNVLQLNLALDDASRES